jgi:hypothetical protein
VILRKQAARANTVGAASIGQRAKFCKLKLLRSLLRRSRDDAQFQTAAHGEIPCYARVDPSARPTPAPSKIANRFIEEPICPFRCGAYRMKQI